MMYFRVIKFLHHNQLGLFRIKDDIAGRKTPKTVTDQLASFLRENRETRRKVIFNLDK